MSPKERLRLSRVLRYDLGLSRLRWNQCPACLGITVQLRLESVSSLRRNSHHNVQVNAIAQNFVDNPTYFPPETQSNPRFQERLKREVPLGRLVSAEEDAEFAAYLCSEPANCFVGQVFPVSGGWVVR